MKLRKKIANWLYKEPNKGRKSMTVEQRKEFAERMARARKERQRRKDELDELRYKAKKLEYETEIEAQRARIAEIQQGYLEDEEHLDYSKLKKIMAEDDYDDVDPLESMATEMLLGGMKNAKLPGLLGGSEERVLDDKTEPEADF